MFYSSPAGAHRHAARLGVKELLKNKAAKRDSLWPRCNIAGDGDDERVESLDGTRILFVDASVRDGDVAGNAGCRRD